MKLWFCISGSGAEVDVPGDFDFDSAIVKMNEVFESDERAEGADFFLDGFIFDPDLESWVVL